MRIDSIRMIPAARCFAVDARIAFDGRNDSIRVRACAHAERPLHGGTSRVRDPISAARSISATLARSVLEDRP
jgi:hypothetical protein